MNLTSFLVQSIAVVLAIAILDGIWISSNIVMYRDMYTKVQGSPMVVNMTGAIASYALMYIAAMFILRPYIERTNASYAESAKIGALFGLCAYGIYNMTNLATLKNYALHVAIVDTLWGTTLFMIVAVLLKAVQTKI